MIAYFKAYYHAIGAKFFAYINPYLPPLKNYTSCGQNILKICYT